MKTDKLEIGVFYYRKKAYFVKMKISYITKEKTSKSNEVIMETFGNNNISWVKKLVEEYKKICLVSVVLKCFKTKCSIFFDWKNETKILSSPSRC